MKLTITQQRIAMRLKAPFIAILFLLFCWLPLVKALRDMPWREIAYEYEDYFAALKQVWRNCNWRRTKNVSSTNAQASKR